MTTVNGSRQYCTFFVDNQHFGVEVDQVQEVIRHQPSTQVPLAPEIVGGLINLRGQIVTAVDLRRRLGLAARTDGRAPMNVVIRTDDGAVSLLVDEIGDVMEVCEDSWEERPDTVRGAARDLIQGVYKVAKRLLLVLDTARAIEMPASGAPAN